MKYGIIIHGGAWAIPDEAKEDHLDGVRAACTLGWQMLEAGKSAVDIVEAVVSLMEDDPTFDAGKGSHLTSSYTVEMDAIIATQDFKIGSVSAIQHVKNPIQVARRVRDATEHVMLVGDGATSFAYTQGFDRAEEIHLLVGRERDRFLKLKDDREFSTKDPFKKQGFGTVGAVVLDKEGSFAIGVSTGGTPMKLAGRVGDTPIWGAGGYVLPSGGSAATGFGEDLIRVLITQRVVTYINVGMSAQKASEAAIGDLGYLVEGLGGVITLDKSGFGLAFNTPRMAFSVQTDTFPQFTGIEPEDLTQCLDQL
ncbi:MAG: isoaspartyl peptidase/L-asparaginase family protein [Candidatus Kariarchaeaceae archaeon]